MAAEERLPRAVLQRRLERILARIDGEKVFRVEWTETLLGRRRCSATFEIDAVHVVGSFARGAPTCGDLDLLLTVRILDGLAPPSRAVARAVAGRPPNVQVHVGTPKENSSLAPFADPCLLWSQAERDWERLLSAVRVDPSAGRFQRLTDALPLSLRQMRMYDLETAESVVRLIGEGVLMSEWRPLSAPLRPTSSWDAETSRRLELLQRSTGKATREILPHIFQYLWDTKAPPSDFSTREATDFAFGPIQIRVGRPLLDVSPLDALGTTAIVMAPHLTRRRQNGLWILSRGPNHPAQDMFANLAFWANVDEDGRLPFSHVYERPDGWWPDHCDAEVFTTERKARSFADDAPTHVARVSGTCLLDAIGHADIVSVDARDSVALTYAGRRYADTFVEGDIDGLATWLRARLSSPGRRTKSRK